MSLITEQLKERIEARIREYEARSSVEFVPVIVRDSGEYSGFRLQATLLSLIATLMYFHGWPTSLGAGMESCASFVVASVVYMVSAWSPVLRWLVPASVKRTEVEQGAGHCFLREEIFNTRRRTGLLIYISVFERAVYLMADRGITAVVPVEEWARLGNRLAQDLGRNTPGVTFLEALDEIMVRLQNSFPPDVDNPNELPDGIRER